MSVDVIANTFKGQYGNSDDTGDLIHVVVNTSQNSDIIKNTSVIFCIDISASMEKSIPIIKSSLLAFRDAVVGKSHKEMEAYTEEERDLLFRKSINLTLITFSMVANIIWSPESNDKFEEVVHGLNVVSMTNMGDALRLAFETIKAKEFVYNWIVVMTDGESNEGPCRTSASFQQMVIKNKPINSKIISLGYGDRFDPEVLHNIGTFVYIEDDEKIPVVFGNLTEEIMNTVGFNCKLFFNEHNINIEINNDDLISAYDHEPGRLLVGSQITETLCCNKTYDWIYKSNSVENITVLLKYTNLYGVEIIQEILPSKYYNDNKSSDNNDNKSCDNNCDNKSNDNNCDTIKGLYFETETKKLIYRLYRITQKLDINVIKQEIKFIENILDSWTDSVAERYKDEIRKMIENINNFKMAKHRNNALNTSVGSGYGTRINSSYVTSIMTSCNHYVTSPQINNNF